MNFKKSDNAISPVISILLMMVTTLLMATVVSAFVFGVGEPLSRSNDIDDIIYFNATTTLEIPSEYSQTQGGVQGQTEACTDNNE